MVSEILIDLINCDLKPFKKENLNIQKFLFFLRQL